MYSYTNDFYPNPTWKIINHRICCSSRFFSHSTAQHTKYPLRTQRFLFSSPSIFNPAVFCCLAAPYSTQNTIRTTRYPLFWVKGRSLGTSRQSHLFHSLFVSLSLPQFRSFPTCFSSRISPFCLHVLLQLFLFSVLAVAIMLAGHGQCTSVYLCLYAWTMDACSGGSAAATQLIRFSLFPLRSSISSFPKSTHLSDVSLLSQWTMMRWMRLN